jgi:hypothetical protein
LSDPTRAQLALAELLIPGRLAQERARLARAMQNPWWLPYQVHPPEARSGDVEVKRQVTTEERALVLNLDRKNVQLRGIRAYPGTFTYLFLGGEVWMSDTPDEVADHVPFIHAARGNVLVNGLGLGVVVQALLRKPEVTRIDVVEKSPDVARLIGPCFAQDPRFCLHVADAWEWTPPEGLRYDWAWHDIWRDISPDNLAEFTRIRKRYFRVARRQWCWAEEMVLGLVRINRILEWAPGDPRAYEVARRELRELNERRHRIPEGI